MAANMDEFVRKCPDELTVALFHPPVLADNCGFPFILLEALLNQVPVSFDKVKQLLIVIFIGGDSFEII
jgi:hypothetical protein